MKIYNIIRDVAPLFYKSLNTIAEFLNKEINIPLVNFSATVAECLFGSALFVILGYAIVKFFTDIVF